MSTQLPTYDEISALLAAQDDLTAPECHGLLCALLSCQAAGSAAEWGQKVMSGALTAEAGAAPEPVSVSAEDADLLERLYLETAKLLDDPELKLELLLPDDEENFDKRLLALTEWCDGYLYGLALAGIKDFDGFSEPVQDYCRDLVEISRLDVDESGDEEGESAFFEVSEYVRLGVLMVHDEMSGHNKAPQGSTVH